MNKPSNEENYLIEVTSEQLEYLRSFYHYDDDEDGYVEMHYSPHWKNNKEDTNHE